jgi:hypothetical protein
MDCEHLHEPGLILTDTLRETATASACLPGKW